MNGNEQRANEEKQKVAHVDSEVVDQVAKDSCDVGRRVSERIKITNSRFKDYIWRGK